MKKFKPRESIRTERLVLLKREHEHDQEMWKAIDESRAELREYLFWVDKQQSVEDVIKSTDLFHKLWDEDGEWAYDIFTVDDYRFIGCVGPHAISFTNQSAEFGYWLRTSETGKGYMKEAVLAVEEELFKNGIHRLVIRCDVNNVKSANVAKRAGYTFESRAKDAVYHYTGLHDLDTYVKISPYPIIGF